MGMQVISCNELFCTCVYKTNKTSFDCNLRNQVIRLQLLQVDDIPVPASCLQLGKMDLLAGSI